MKAVIPAAGFGIKFLPATKAQPKEMLPVYDKPIIQYVVEEAVNSGIDDILIITGKNKYSIENHFDKSFELEQTLQNVGKYDYLKQVREITDLANISYVKQKSQKGLGDAIYCAKKHVGGEPFAVLLGDTITKGSTLCTKQLIDIYKKYDSPVISIKKLPKEKIERYGVINGEEIEITDPKGMTLDNFIKMTEDKEIEVTFTEATISVPITGKNSNVLAIFAVLVVIGATLILLHPKKKKKLVIER